MQDKIRLIVVAILLAGLFLLIKYGLSRPYVAKDTVLYLALALLILFAYPVYRMVRAIAETSHPLPIAIAAILLAALFAWVGSWPVRWAAVNYFSTVDNTAAEIVGLERCRGKFCACRNKWTLRMGNGEQHKLCTQRINITDSTHIAHGEPVNVVVRHSFFDQSIE